MKPKLECVGIGVIVENKNERWILIKDKTDKKTYQQALKRGIELELYGLHTERKEETQTYDTLYAFKE